MISCESATQGINIYYSVIKFLELKGVIWAGDSLSLTIEPLGELFSSKVTLTDGDGNTYKDVYWELGQVFGPFQSGKLYNIQLRLEYQLPVMRDDFGTDFQSVHPRDYISSFDFSMENTVNKTHMLVTLGEHAFHFPLGVDSEQELETGHIVALRHQHDYCSVSVKAHADAPYTHKAFPRFSLM